ncbi:MAG: hypothetical protein Q9204_004389 [Flavoplaca sp. TL-2023a]
MSQPAAQCPHEGDPDFYGLGIRSGIYLQLTTAVVAKYFHPEAIPENLTANTIFLLALFAALVIATLGPGLRPEEVFILLQLCFGFLLSVLSILGGRRPSPSGHSATPRPPPIASYFRLMLTLAICTYSVWFWFPGKDKMKVAGCASYMFLFTNISLFGGGPVFYQIQSAILIVPLGVLFGWYSFLLLWFSISSFVSSSMRAVELARKGTQRAGGRQLTRHPQNFVKTIPKTALTLWWINAQGPNLSRPAQSDKVSWTLRIEDRSKVAATRIMSRFTGWSCTMIGSTLPAFSLICLLWTILSVEFTLRFNQINGVYDIRSTGQLIPFIIGLIRFLSLCHGTLRISYTDISIDPRQDLDEAANPSREAGMLMEKGRANQNPGHN